MRILRLISFFFLFYAANQQINYIINGGFQFPILTTQNGKIIDGWNGTKFDLKNDPTFNLGYGQYVDLQKAIYQNGYISQIITLPYNGTYKLTYYQLARTKNYGNYAVQIYWNSVLQAIKQANTTLVTIENLNLYGICGNNQLMFVEVGNSSDNHGMYIDQVKLELVQAQTTNQTTYANQTNMINQTNLSNYLNNSNSNNTDNLTNNIVFNETKNSTNQVNQTQNPTNSTNSTNSTYNIIQNTTQILNNEQNYVQKNNLNFINQKQQVQFYFAVSMSILISRATSVRFIFIFLQQLWLYAYDSRDYQEILEEIFDMVSNIQQLKFQFLERWLHFMENSKPLPFTNYIPYASSNFKIPTTTLQNLLPFLIYTIPQKIFSCFLLCILYKLTKNSYIGSFLFKYSKFYLALFQITLQGEIAYFVFVCQYHLNNSFNFQFCDKISFLITIIFLYVLLLYSSSFYLLLRYLVPAKPNQYLSQFNNKVQSHFLMTLLCFLKGYSKGLIFFYFFSNYECQIVLLCLMRVIIISLLIIFQQKSKVFQTRSMFCLSLLFDTLFLLFNFCLIFQYILQIQKQYQVDSIVRQISIQLMGLMVFINICRIVIDIIPIKSIRKNPRKKPNELQKVQQIPSKKRSRQIVKVTYFKNIKT